MEERVNALFETYWKEPKVRRILQFWVRRFDPHTALQIQMDALLRCLRHHQFNHPSGQTFYSSLKRFLFWECERERGRTPNRPTYRSELNHVVDPKSDTQAAEIDELYTYLSELSWSEQAILDQRFFQGLTYEEIGRANGYGEQTAKRRVEAALNQLRSVYLPHGLDYLGVIK